MLDAAEDQISDLEDMINTPTHTHRQSSKKKKEFKNNKSLNILNNMKQKNVYIIGIPEGQESKQGIKNLFEGIMTKISLIW